MRGLVELPELKARLIGEDLIGTPFGKPPLALTPGWPTARHVLAFTLVRMPAYEKFRLEPPSDGLWPDWEDLRKWLMVELPAELPAQWDAHWAGPTQEANNEALD